MDEESASASIEVAGTVTSVTPLMVETNGAETSCPALRIDDYSPVLNDPVRVKLQSPAAPIIQGKVTDG